MQDAQYAAELLCGRSENGTIHERGVNEIECDHAASLLCTAVEEGGVHKDRTAGNCSALAVNDAAIEVGAAVGECGAIQRQQLPTSDGNCAPVQFCA